MEVRKSERLDKLVSGALKEVLEMGGDEHELFDDCLAEEAAHEVTQFEDELHDMDGSDLWDLKVDGFEAGLRIGLEIASLSVSAQVFSTSVDPDGFDEPVMYRVLWYVCQDEEELLSRLEESWEEYRESLRKELGLLPFKQE